MNTLSERMGFEKAPEILQLDAMTEGLSNQLFNFCCQLIANEFSQRLELEEKINNALKLKRETFKLCSRDNYSGRRGEFSEKEFSSCFEKLNFHQKYSVIEMIISQYFLEQYQTEKIPCLKKPTPVDELNQILQRENSGYRMTEDVFIPITSQEELKSILEAKHSEVGTVENHIKKAIELFRDREHPDYANTIKESVLALEALTRTITGKEKKTLGQLIKTFDLHPALEEVIKKLYGYAGDADGIRHAKKETDSEVNFNTAKFILVITSALINFISRKDQSIS